jgi:hypothetical protein
VPAGQAEREGKGNGGRRQGGRGEGKTETVLPSSLLSSSWTEAMKNKIWMNNKIFLFLYVSSRIETWRRV